MDDIYQITIPSAPFRRPSDASRRSWASSRMSLALSRMSRASSRMSQGLPLGPRPPSRRGNWTNFYSLSCGESNQISEDTVDWSHRCRPGHHQIPNHNHRCGRAQKFLLAMPQQQALFRCYCPGKLVQHHPFKKKFLGRWLVACCHHLASGVTEECPSALDCFWATTLDLWLPRGYDFDLLQ